MKFEKDSQKVRVVGVYSSKYPDTFYKGPEYFVTDERNQLEFSLEGIVGDRHHGFTAVSGGRMKGLYPKGTVVRNNRMWLGVSPQEIEAIAQGLSIDGRLTPELLGANLVLEGIDALSTLAPMTYLVFSPTEMGKPQDPDNVVLVVYGQALPCTIAGKVLANALGEPSLESRFPAAAIGRRGTTGWVEKGGIIRPGYTGLVYRATGKD